MKDKNLTKIKEVVESILPKSKVILFGSRARENFGYQSDYDILVVVEVNLTVKEKRHFASIIADKLAEMEILTDVLVRTEEDVKYLKDRIGSVTREAILEGKTL